MDDLACPGRCPGRGSFAGAPAGGAAMTLQEATGTKMGLSLGQKVRDVPAGGAALLGRLTKMS